MNEYAAVIRLLQDRLEGLLAIYLFGSRASGNQHAHSDLDLAVLAAQPLSARQRFELAQEIALLVDCNVDLIDLRQASTVLRSQIIGTARPLQRAQTPEVDAFEDFVYADYARLNEERAGILADIRQRGRVHRG